MRISDCSSDVCSSDLIALGEQDLAVLGDGNGGARNVAARKRRSHEPIQPRFDISAVERSSAGFQAFRRLGRIAGRRRCGRRMPGPPKERARDATAQAERDRKSFAEGKSVSGRVERGGGSIIKRKTRNT